MWSVAAPRAAQQDDTVRRDPAPSKLAYRYHRMMLRPLTRRLVTRVLPICAVIGVGALWAAQPAQQAWISSTTTAMWEAMENRPEFRVSGMAVEGAQDALVTQIRDTLELNFPVSQFDLDLVALRAKVLELPAVKAARLNVGSGGVLEVSVTERAPVALWRTPTGLYLMDDEGVLTGSVEARAARPNLPLLAGDGVADPKLVAQARAIIGAASPVEGRVRALVRRGARRWDLVLDRDQRILLPAQSPVEALERVMALHQATDVLERDLTAIDLRLPHRPTLRLSAPANETLRAARLALSKEN